jgi:hypothetical protein
MAVFTVPLDYNEAADRLTVPICVSDVDNRGNPVHFEWIERGVAPVAEKLVGLAERLLHDKWRASEITEPIVHQLSHDFGPNLGVEPSARVLSGRGGTQKIYRRAAVERVARPRLSCLRILWNL